jgi:hypothetical protein
MKTNNKIISILTMVGVILLFISCGGSYFVAADSEFSTSSDSSDDVGEITSKLITLGYDVEMATSNIIETKVERFYINRGSIHETEMQSWIRAFPKQGKVRVFCTERKMYSYHHRTMKLEYDKNWKFTPCKNPHIIERIRITINRLEESLKAS